jgi:hypothetical protein
VGWRLRVSEAQAAILDHWAKDAGHEMMLVAAEQLHELVGGLRSPATKAFNHQADLFARGALTKGAHRGVQLCR